MPADAAAAPRRKRRLKRRPEAAAPTATTAPTPTHRTGKKRKRSASAKPTQQPPARPAQQPSPQPDLQALRRKIADACADMARLGLSQGQSGDASARVPGGMLISPFGVSHDSVAPEQIVFVSDDGRFDSELLPARAWQLHLGVYKKVQAASAIVHGHPTYCTALASLRRNVPAFHYMVACAGGHELKCSEYAPWGTEELVEKVVAALGDRKSCLIANHGMLCHAANLDKALGIANETECLARQFTIAQSTNCKPAVLSTAEMNKMLIKFKSYGKQPSELTGLTAEERKHAIEPPPKRPPATGKLLHEALRSEVIQVCLRMSALGINQGTSGNASARVPGGFVVTASGVPYQAMKPEQVVFVDMEGRYEGKWLPSSEWRMHYDIYKSVPEAAAVVHAHPTYCTALACLRKDIPAFHHMVGCAGGTEIKCSDYETFGTQDLSDSMLDALGDRRSCLLANHGMICHGPDLQTALSLAHETEILARQYITALSLNSPPKEVSPADVRRASQQLRAGRK